MRGLRIKTSAQSSEIYGLNNTIQTGPPQGQGNSANEFSEAA